MTVAKLMFINVIQRMIRESKQALLHQDESQKDSFVESLKIISMAAILNEYSEIKWQDLCKTTEASLVELSYNELTTASVFHFFSGYLKMKL
jgi:hypothetical protein